SIPGAMLGGLLLGVAEAFGADVFGDQYKDVVAGGQRGRGLVWPGQGGITWLR
ncbi:hypothetical protein I5J04_31710, partial [Pseudomonas aeruginosa]|nr:hypothetical protein [Pseudomonas aeruginosa]